MEFYREERVLASGEHILDQILVDGGHGACWGRFEGKKKDGSAVKLAFADVYGFDTGKVVFRKSYFFVPLV